MQENSVQNQSLLREKEDPELPDFLNWKVRSICEKSLLWGNKPGSQLCHRKLGISCSNTWSRRGSWGRQTGGKQDPLSVGFWGQQNQLQRAKPRCQLLTPGVPRIVEFPRGACWKQNKSCLTLSLSLHPRPKCKCLWYYTEFWALKNSLLYLPILCFSSKCKRINENNHRLCPPIQLLTSWFWSSACWRRKKKKNFSKEFLAHQYLLHLSGHKSGNTG